MRILDRYVIRSFLYSAMLWFIVMMSLRIVVDLFVNMDEFTKLGKPFLDFTAANGDMVRDILTYYFYHSLIYFIELGGVIIVASAAFTLARMNQSNELTAMMASGVSLHRVAVPIILCSVLLGGLIVLDQEYLIPSVAEKLVREKDDVPGLKQFPIRMATDGTGAIWNSPEYSTSSSTMRQPVAVIRDQATKTTEVGRIFGSTGYPDTMSGGKRGWVLTAGSMLLTASNNTVRHPDYKLIFTSMGPDEIVRQVLQKNPQQKDEPGIKVNLVETTDEKTGLTIQGVLTPDSPGGGKMRGGKLEMARFTFRTPEGQVLGTFFAPSALWKVKDGQTFWELTDGKLFYETDLNGRDLALRQSGRWLDYMSTSQLTELLKSKRINDPRMAILTRHTRATDPICNVIMLLLGLPFILSRERNIKASAGLCMLMVGAFYAFIYICRNMGLPPEWGAWLAVLLFGPVAVVMLDSVKT